MTTALQQQLLHDYLSYSDTVFAYSEQLSKQIMNYEPKQILLLHANQLEADHISELIGLFRKLSLHNPGRCVERSGVRSA